VIIPLVDLVGQYQHIGTEVIAAVERVMATGDFILGEEVERFEAAFARYCRASYCVAVSSGTEALHLTLRALGIGRGDEVIVPVNTFAATAFAVSYTGAAPVFVDIDATDYTLDVELLERAISRRTKAIIPVHLYGHSADLDAILALADRYHLKVIEDACQAHGAQYRGRPVGGIGHAGCFSFYPGKNLGAYGDGGAVVTGDGELADRIRLLQNFAQRPKNVHLAVGFNSRLDTLQAAVLLVKLPYLDGWNQRRRAAAEQYGQLLSGMGVLVPATRSGVSHVYHLYVIQHERRDELLSFLRAHGIAAGVHYPLPLSRQVPYLAARAVPHGAPVATTLSRKILSLPMFPEITHHQLATVVYAIRSFDESHPTSFDRSRLSIPYVS
jgi:dTDP-4-amino-4,6-dideoxygalactose transaminase